MQYYMVWVWKKNSQNHLVAISRRSRPQHSLICKFKQDIKLRKEM